MKEGNCSVNVGTTARKDTIRAGIATSAGMSTTGINTNGGMCTSTSTSAATVCIKSYTSIALATADSCLTTTTKYNHNVCHMRPNNEF